MSDVLIDTEALIWFTEGSPKLSPLARNAIDDVAVRQWVSAACIWEMAIKIRLGKLILQSGTLAEVVESLSVNDIGQLPVTFADALTIQSLTSGKHQDPFDRLIAAQCLGLDLTLVSSDKAFDACGVRRVW